jgi:hypothetical protein
MIQCYRLEQARATGLKELALHPDMRRFRAAVTTNSCALDFFQGLWGPGGAVAPAGGVLHTRRSRRCAFMGASQPCLTRVSACLALLSQQSINRALPIPCGARKDEYLLGRQRVFSSCTEARRAILVLVGVPESVLAWADFRLSHDRQTDRAFRRCVVQARRLPSRRADRARPCASRTDQKSRWYSNSSSLRLCLRFCLGLPSGVGAISAPSVRDRVIRTSNSYERLSRRN